VSNLSQAIHFLVDNDFLEGVELKPGDADSEQIKVLESASLADMSTDTVTNVIHVDRSLPPPQHPNDSKLVSDQSSAMIMVAT
jgi:hypothetical protein